jgi:hypothetical protein
LFTLGDVHVDKRQIAFIGLLQEEHEAPLKRINNFQAKFSAHVYLIIDNYCIDGTVYLPTQTINVAQTVSSISSQFYAVTHASIHSTHGRRFRLPLAVVNQRRVKVVGVPMPTTDREHVQSLAGTTNVLNADDAVLRECQELQHLVEADQRGRTSPSSLTAIGSELANREAFSVPLSACNP